ncbi:MAG: hypothetical protein JKX97_06865 [Candidatus Lindowbacteria bacterium]|nr:hypothetical protein [Candidatus Lindowbacteria bacterium]
MLKLSPGIKGIGLVLLIMPLAHVLVQGTMDLGLDKYGEIAMAVLGIGLVLATIRIRSSTIQASAGLLAGILLWGAIGELGGLLQSGSSHGESHVHGAPTLGQWSLILVILIFYGLMGFKPFGRVIGEGRAARRLGTFVAFEFFVIVWFFHVVLLTTFYHPWFGPDSPIMYVVLALCATGVLVVKPYLLRARNLGEGIRVVCGRAAFSGRALK